jgi:DNA-binding response OmpR family regulator
VTTLGADAFFHKPVRMRRLVEKAHALLGVATPAPAVPAAAGKATT